MMRAGLAGFLLSGAVLLAADVTGKWDFAVETSQGSGSPSFDFKQSGEKLTGVYNGMFGTANVTGTVKGDGIEFEFLVNPGGQTAKMVYKGVIQDATHMKGEVALGDFGSGTWTATKK
jgi:hypothetical protein